MPYEGVQLFAVKYFQKRFGLRKYQISTDLNLEKKLPSSA